MKEPGEERSFPENTDKPGHKETKAETNVLGVSVCAQARDMVRGCSATPAGTPGALVAICA